MRFMIADTEYIVKTRQAIEILDVVEKSGILDKVKKLQNGIKEGDVSEMISMIPFSYKLAYEVLTIATGKYANGTIERNTAVVDDMEAVDLPIHAVTIVKTLILPVSYVISDDTLNNEKKTISPPPVSSEESNGKPDASQDLMASLEISTTSSVTKDTKTE